MAKFIFDEEIYGIFEHSRIDSYNRKELDWKIHKFSFNQTRSNDNNNHKNLKKLIFDATQIMK